jgi:hypothetical protein
MGLGAKRVAWAMVAAGLLAAGAAADEARVQGCVVRLVNVDAQNVPTFRGECVWSLAPESVAAVLVDPNRNRSSMLKSRQELKDGRVVNVQRTGWPFEDRQSTLVFSDEPQPDGGIIRRYHLAPAQAPLADGAVQVRVDQGSWVVARDPNGVRVVLEMTYEPGGNLPTSIVQSMSPKYIARGLDELRVNTEKLARAGGALPPVGAGPPQR